MAENKKFDFTMLAWGADAASPFASGLFSAVSTLKSNKAEKKLANWKNQMTNLSAAQQQNALAFNLTQTADTLHLKSIEAQVQGAQARGKVLSYQGASGTKGRSRNKAMQEISASLSAADQAYQRELTSARDNYSLNYANIDMSRQTGQQVAQTKSLTGDILGASLGLAETAWDFTSMFKEEKDG